MSFPQKKRGFRKIVIDASPPDYDPKIVTPAFVRKVIEYALSQRWDVEGKAGITKIIYRDNQFMGENDNG